MEMMVIRDDNTVKSAEHKYYYKGSCSYTNTFFKNQSPDHGVIESSSDDQKVEEKEETPQMEMMVINGDNTGEVTEHKLCYKGSCSYTNTIFKNQNPDHGVLESLSDDQKDEEKEETPQMEMMVIGDDNTVEAAEHKLYYKGSCSYADTFFKNQNPDNGLMESSSDDQKVEEKEEIPQEVRDKHHPTSVLVPRRPRTPRIIIGTIASHQNNKMSLFRDEYYKSKKLRGAEEIKAKLLIKRNRMNKALERKLKKREELMRHYATINLPQQLRDHIDGIFLGGGSTSPPVFVIEKSLTVSDLKEDQLRLSMPINNVNAEFWEKFLNESEKGLLGTGHLRHEYMEVEVVDIVSKREYKNVKFRK